MRLTAVRAFILFFLYFSAYYVCCYAPTYQDKFLVCENLLGNKSDSIVCFPAINRHRTETGFCTWQLQINWKLWGEPQIKDEQEALHLCGHIQGPQGHLEEPQLSSHSYPQGYLRDEPQSSHNSPVWQTAACPRSATSAPNNQPKKNHKKQEDPWERERRRSKPDRPDKRNRAAYSKRRCDKFWQRTKNYAFQRPDGS